MQRIHGAHIEYFVGEVLPGRVFAKCGVKNVVQEQRADRLNVVRRNTTERVASETAGERQNRLVSIRTNLAERIENESVPE